MAEECFKWAGEAQTDEVRAPLLATEAAPVL
jgi:hypothetical protein